ncbi:MAG: hypothetical protein ABIV06_02495, partial [Thermoanaerobaculia bacterium]
MKKKFAFAFVAVSAFLSTCLMASGSEPVEHSADEARLWIATSHHIVGVGLSSGASVFEEASREPVRSMAVDKAGSSLWILRDEGLERLDLRAVAASESVSAFAPSAAGSGLFLDLDSAGVQVVAAGLVERFSGMGQLLESRPEVLSTHRRALLEARECVDPIDGGRLVAIADGMHWEHENPARSSTRMELSGIVWTRCDAFGGAWAGTSNRLLRVDTAGRISVDLTLPENRGGVRAVSSDSRDGALWVGTQRQVLRLGLDGVPQVVFETEPDESITAIAFELVGGAGAIQVPAHRAGPGARAVSMVSVASLLNGTEVAFQGRVLFPDSRPVAGLEVVVFADSIARTTTAADGTFLTPAATFAPAGSNILIVFQKTTASGRIYSAQSWGGTPGQTYDMGDRYVDYACPADFAAGDFPASALNGDVRSMVVFDSGSGPALYVAGTFTTAGGVTVNRVAKWDGTQWTALGSGLGGGTTPTVDSLVVFDDGTGAKLYAGGNFTTSGATSVKYVGKWTGSAWTQVGLGLAAQVYALAVFDDGSGAKLYAGGSFTTANSITFNRLAKWSGTAWQAVSSGLNGEVRALVAHNDGSGNKLYAGGLFTQAGGSITANRIARWSGSAWSAVGTGVAGGSPIQVNSLLPWNDGSGLKLYAAGRFTTAGSATVNSIASWDGAAWAGLGIGLGTQVNALATFDDGSGSALYAAGSFTTVSGTAFNRLARWNTIAWAPVGSGLNGNALADVPGTLPGKESSLYIGGAFSTANGVTSTRVARLRRPLTCADSTPPDLAFVAPPAGSVPGSPTPPLTFGYGDFGSGVQMGSIVLTQGGTPLATSCSYTADTANCTLLQPLSGGAVTLTATIRDLAGNTSLPVTRSLVVEDLVPPALAITEPLEGATGVAARPAVRFTYSDAGSGIDTASLAIVVQGTSLAIECQPSVSTAVCVPLMDLPAGAIALSATIRDLQGNSSSAAVVSFNVTATPSYSVTFTGTTRFEDGSPAGGARVELLHTATPFATSAVDGSFSLGPVNLASLSPIDLTARISVSFKPYVGFLNDFTPLAAGANAVGAITLKKRCGFGEITTPWVGTEATLAGNVFTATLFDDGVGAEIFVAGDFNSASQGTRAQIARWTSAGWADVGGGFDYKVQPIVRSLSTFDEGSGEVLFAAGLFDRAGGATANNLARWDGESWTEVGL